MTATYSARNWIFHLAALLAMIAGGSLIGGPARADMAAAQSAIAAGNFPAAGAALAPLAAAGDAQAQYQWAALSLDGHPVGLPSDRALSLLVQSAAQGNGHAQARLGMAYARGDQVVEDNLAAYHWLSRASTAQDLTPEERDNVTTMQQSLLEQLAPRQKAYGSSDTDATTGFAGDSGTSSTKAIQPTPKPKPASPTSVSTVPLFEDKPLPNPSDDPADATTPAATVDTKIMAQPAKIKVTPTKPVKSTSKATPANSPAVTTATKIAPIAAAPTDLVTTAAPVATASPVSGASTTATATLVSAAPSAPTSNKRLYLVQMASLPSATAATAEAERLQKKYAKLLQGMSVSVRPVDLGSKGIMQRVVAGPYGDAATAKNQCAQLTAHKQACRIIVSAE